MIKNIHNIPPEIVDITVNLLNEETDNKYIKDNYYYRMLDIQDYVNEVIKQYEKIRNNGKNSNNNRYSSWNKV